MRFIATCKMGLESTVNFQLRRLGIEVVATEDARVVFEGGYDAMARALLWLRTAERVLMVAAEFPATSFDALFEGTKRVDWKVGQKHPVLRFGLPKHREESRC